MPFSAIKPALYCFRFANQTTGEKQQSQWKISFLLNFIQEYTRTHTHLICTRKLIRIIRKKTLITLINSFINFSANKNKSKAVHPITKPFSLCVCACVYMCLCVCRCVFFCPVEPTTRSGLPFVWKTIEFAGYGCVHSFEA